MVTLEFFEVARKLSYLRWLNVMQEKYFRGPTPVSMRNH